jgi:glycosyltransferase involved in cell wall biosynthesis
VSLLAIIFCKLNHTFIGLRSDSVFLYKKTNLKWKLKSLILPQIYKLFDIGFTVGELARFYMHTYGFKESQLFFFPYAVNNSWINKLCIKYRKNRENIRLGLGIPADAFVILGIKKFVHRENPMGLLRGFKYLLDVNTNAYLIMVGEGAEREKIESYIKTNHLKNRVVLTGYQPYSLLPKFFAIADVFVHTALFEPWGCSVNEAMACGLPVICANTVGASYDLVEDGVNGYIYNVERDEELYFYLQKMYKLDKKHLKLMGEQSRNIINKYSFDTTIIEITKALKSLKR